MRGWFTHDPNKMTPTKCSRCTQPYHRYSPEDPEHEATDTACINSLMNRIEDLEYELAQRMRHDRVEAQRPDVPWADPPIVRGYTVTFVRAAERVRKRYRAVLDKLRDK